MAISNKGTRKIDRVIVVTVFFVLICVLYTVKMISITANAPEPAGAFDSSRHERYITLNGVRGDIYDRNGKKLVGSRYSYDFYIDYNTLPNTRFGKYYAILSLINEVKASSDSVSMYEDIFPMEGNYPDFSWKAEALDTESLIYAKLQKFVDLNKLKNVLGEEKGCENIISYFNKMYKFDKVTSPEGEYFSDELIGELMRFWYNAELSDFGRYAQFRLAENVSEELRLSVLERGMEGASFKLVTKREYCYPGYASQILGRVGKIQAEDWEHYSSKGYSMDAYVGISGCESAFEDYLRGHDGVLVVVEDNDGNRIDEYYKTEPLPGNDIYLTIDIDLQIAAEDGLKEGVEYAVSHASGSKTGEDCNAGALVAEDPRNGELLAVASYPSYDLTTFNKDYDKLKNDPASPFNNRAFDGLYAPGSTFKIATSAVGLESGVIDSGTLLYCGGIYDRFPDYKPKCSIYDSTHSGHGHINVSEALCVSCNCFYFEVGHLLGIERLNSYCRSLGLGVKTGVELQEKSGVLAGKTYREENNQGAWSGGDTIQAAIGQSDNLFTPVQLASYVSTVLNGGVRYRSRLLYKVVDYRTGECLPIDGKEVLGRANISEGTSKIIGSAMRDMVTESATVSYFMRNVPVAVGGKTGTAQIGKKNSENAVFVATAPYNSPDIVVSAVLEKGHMGVYTSLPIARVLEEYYSDRGNG